MDATAQILDLKRRIQNLEIALALAIPKGGMNPTLYQGVDCDGQVYPWSTFFQSGKSTREEYEVEKICMRIGDDGAHGRDAAGQTAPIGMARGVSGRFLSLVDTLPAGVATEVE